MHMQGKPAGYPSRPWLIQDITGYDQESLRGMMPGGMMPGGMMPGGMMPGGMMPGGMAPGGMWPGGMAPGGMWPSGMAPGSMWPGGMWPGGMWPGTMGPGGTCPEGALPGGWFEELWQTEVSPEGVEMEEPGEVEVEEQEELREMERGPMAPGGMMPGGMVPGGQMPGGMMPGGQIPGARPNERPMGELAPAPARPMRPAQPMQPALPGIPAPPSPVPPGGRPGPGGAELQAFVRRLEAYLQDEANAQSFYRAMASQAADSTVKRYLTDAANDEQKHFRLLSGLYQQLTGRTYQVKPEPTEFASLREGLLMAIDGEIEAYTEYKTEYQRFADPGIRQIFFELFSDEIEHAVLFNTALHILATEA